MNSSVTLNHDQQLYVIPSGNGYSCLGFQVCEDRATALAAELLTLGISTPFPLPSGTLARYQQYSEMMDTAREYNKRTGYRFQCELHPLLKGKEGKRVEVTSRDGSKRRFWVGKSTGWIPVHLEIARRTSTGGGAVYGDFTAVTVVR